MKIFSSLNIYCLAGCMLLSACSQANNSNSVKTEKVFDEQRSLNTSLSVNNHISQMTPEYVESVARIAYIWGWPLINMHNRHQVFSQVPVQGLLGGVMPVAPVNYLTILPKYADPEQKDVAHPNQDVFYGFGITNLDKSPVVLQVPNFGERFWMYGLMNQRTDAFGELGKMYGTQPGFYLLAGPNWKGDVPEGINKVIYSETSINAVIPRVFVEDEKDDQNKVQSYINQIAMYPLSEYNGHMKTTVWRELPVLPEQNKTDKEKGWVNPEKFFDQLPAVLKEVKPLQGEEVMYSMINQVLDAAKSNEEYRKILRRTAVNMEKSAIDSLFYFNNVGVEVENHWTRPFNNGAFGLDYLTRTAIAKSNIFTNHFRETTYFYQYRDKDGTRLDGSKHSYTITFKKGELPPVDGFWSLTMYDENHFFCSNDIKRYSLGTKSKNLKYNDDGSLTLYIQKESPSEELKNNWLPAPDGIFAVTLRCYAPENSIIEGKWCPPAVITKK